MMGERGWLPACDFCLDYVSGICTDQEKLAFESHLPYCEDLPDGSRGAAHRMGGSSYGHGTD